MTTQFGVPKVAKYFETSIHYGMSCQPPKYYEHKECWMMNRQSVLLTIQPQEKTKGVHVEIE